MAKTLIEIENDFQSIDNIPTLPNIVHELIELIDKEVSMSRISEILAIDPPITTKVLKIANSAFYGVRQRIDTLRRALVVLGTTEITNIVLGASFLKVLKVSETMNQFDLRKFWEHSILVAHFSKLLVKALQMKTHGEEYTAGLIHDIGKIVIYQYYTKELIDVMNLVCENRVSGYLAEKTVLGADHMYYGYLLAKKWSLPQNLQQVILHHHKPILADSHKELVAVVNIANSIAVSMKIFPEKYPFDEPNTSQAYLILKNYTPNFDLSAFRATLSDEVTKVRKLINFIQEVEENA